MKFTKIITISAFGVLLASCDPASQMQIEGSATNTTAHKHQMPNGSYHTHSHSNGGDTSHSHSMGQIKKEMMKP